MAADGNYARFKKFVKPCVLIGSPANNNVLKIRDNSEFVLTKITNNMKVFCISAHC